jgi:ribosomal protein S24E
MELEIIGKDENVLLARTDVRFRIDHRGAATPAIGDVRSKLAELLGAKAELVVVKRYVTPFGAGQAEGSASVYADGKALMRVEPKPTLVKNGLVEAEKKEKKEKPAAEAKPEPKHEGKAKEAKPEKEAAAAEAKGEAKHERKEAPAAEAKHEGKGEAKEAKHEKKEPHAAAKHEAKGGEGGA